MLPNCSSSLPSRKHVTKYKHMWKWIIEFITKSESCGIKIDRVNSVRFTKLFTLLYLLIHQIYFISGDVIKRTYFLMSSPVNQYIRARTDKCSINMASTISFWATEILFVHRQQWKYSGSKWDPAEWLEWIGPADRLKRDLTVHSMSLLIPIHGMKEMPTN